MKQTVSTPNETLFRDRNALEFGYMPETIRFRETQISAIRKNIQPARYGACPINMILRGPPGTGKTTTIKHLFREIAETNTHIVPVLVNCQIMQTEYGVFQKIYEAAFHQEPPVSGISLQRLIGRLGREFSRHDAVYLICFDDAVSLCHNNIMENVLRILLRLHEEYPGVRIGIIVTVNTIEKNTTNYLSASIRSVFQPLQIVFPSYKENEVRTIMHDMAKTALWPGVISPGLLDSIIKETMEINNLRIGIGLLKCAVKHAESENHTSVTKADVQASFQMVEDIQLRTVVRKLGTQEKTMLNTIARLLQNNGESMISGELYQALEKQVPMCYSLFRRRLTKFCNLGLIKMDRPPIWGNTRLILMQYDAGKIINACNHRE